MSLRHINSTGWFTVVVARVTAMMHHHFSLHLEVAVQWYRKAQESIFFLSESFKNERM